MGAVTDSDRMRIGELVDESEDSFRVKRTTVETATIARGFGVWVSLVYAGDDEEDPDRPVAADMGIVEISPAECTFVGETFCVRIGENAYVPVENFGDDDEDLAADRFFVEYPDALRHCAEIRRALSFRGLEVCS